MVAYCGTFVLLTCASGRQVRAVGQHLQEEGKKLGLRVLSVEGQDNGRWLLIDFGDIVVHVFDEHTRGFYDLDGLWADAPRLDLPETALAV